MPVRTLGLEKGWIVRSHVGWRGELVSAFFIRVWKPLARISASGGIGP